MGEGIGAVGLIKPRGPVRLFEWCSAGAMFCFLLLPWITGYPIHSSGHEYLLRVGVNLQQVSMVIGLVGLARMYVLYHHGRFRGACPWLRAAFSFLGASLWAEMLTVLLNFGADAHLTSAGVCQYAPLVICEFVSLHRAVQDGLDLWK